MGCLHLQFQKSPTGNFEERNLPVRNSGTVIIKIVINNNRKVQRPVIANDIYLHPYMNKGC